MRGDYSLTIIVGYDDGKGEEGYGPLTHDPVNVNVVLEAATEAEAMTEAQRLETALGGLRNLFKWHALDDPEDMGSSAADQCSDLYELMGHVGLKVV